MCGASLFIGDYADFIADYTDIMRIGRPKGVDYWRKYSCHSYVSFAAKRGIIGIIGTNGQNDQHCLERGQWGVYFRGSGKKICGCANMQMCELVNERVGGPVLKFFDIEDLQESRT